MYKPEVNNTTKEILKGLEEWAGSPAHSSPFFDFYLELLKMQADVEKQAGIPAVGVSQEEITSRITSGQPLAKINELDIDWALADSVFKKMAGLFSKYSDTLQGFGKNAGDNLPEMTASLAQSWLDGDLPGAGKSGLEPSALATLIHHTIRPFLTGYGLAFTERFNHYSWRRGCCPVCGSIPSFSYLEKEKGARYLICSCCNTSWLYQRLDCPFCHNVEQPLLSYRTDESGLYRVYTCDKCKRYLKAVDLRKAEGDINLGLEMLVTGDLDLQAQELGYKPGEDLSFPA